MMYYRPDLVDLTQLPKSRTEWPLGVWGEDPRDATPENGKECMEKSIELMIKAFKEAGI